MVILFFPYIMKYISILISCKILIQNPCKIWCRAHYYATMTIVLKNKYLYRNLLYKELYCKLCCLIIQIEHWLATKEPSNQMPFFNEIILTISFLYKKTYHVFCAFIWKHLCFGVYFSKKLNYISFVTLGSPGILMSIHSGITVLLTFLIYEI